MALGIFESMKGRNQMAVKYFVGRFSKPGKGIPQVELLDNDGKPILEDGKPKLGNEQFICNQLTDESISYESAEAFIEDVIASVGGNLEDAAECYRTGWNRVFRLRAAGLDEYQKAARGVIKLALPWTKGLTVDEVADKLKAMNG